MTILVTNDDGVNSEGLKALIEWLKKLGKVFVVAPDRQRSGTGLSITLDRPLRIQRISRRIFSVDGMPADCVTLAIHRLLKSTPDLIVSGINDGQNVGHDIYHSGTVGAAILGTMSGIPSMAMSIARTNFSGVQQDSFYYDTAAQIALKLARMIFERKLPVGTLLNVNVPNLPLSEIKGIEITRHCGATYDIEIHHQLDPKGNECYWVGGEFQEREEHSETDLNALHRHKVSITPLRLDLTDYAMMQELSNWILDTEY